MLITKLRDHFHFSQITTIRSFLVLSMSVIAISIVTGCSGVLSTEVISAAPANPAETNQSPSAPPTENTNKTISPVVVQRDMYNDAESDIISFFARQLVDESVPTDVQISVSRGEYGYAIDLVAPDALLGNDPESMAEDVLIVRVQGPFEQQFPIPLVEQLANPDLGAVALKSVTSAFYIVDASDGRVLSGTSFFNDEADTKQLTPNPQKTVALVKADSKYESDVITLTLNDLLDN